MAPARTGIEISQSDPVRQYTAEEKQRITENLGALLVRVHSGYFSDRPLQLSLLLDFHRSLFEGVRGHAGRARSKDFGSEVLTFGPHSSLHRRDVIKALEKVCADGERMLRSVQENPNDPDYEGGALRIAVWIHARIIQIHPFEDGNGRTARAVLNYALVRVGLRPVPAEIPKQEYFAALNRYFLEGDPGPLTDVFLGAYLVP